jgi:hypothetical protein
MANNYYLYFDNFNEKYHIFPYDLDHSLGQGWDGAPVFENQLSDTELYHYGELFSFLSGQPIDHPFMETLFEIESFKILYENYLVILLNTTFQFDFFKYFIDRYQPIFQDDSTQSMTSLTFGYRNLEKFIQLKRESVLLQLNKTT